MVYDVRLPLTVTSVQPETPGYLSVYFDRPWGFSFDPGDWIEFDTAGLGLDGGNVYSLASSPDEPELRITLRAGVSPFKRKLADLQPGDKLDMVEYGNDYVFQLHEHRPAVLIAGGIGVAPFRSMLKDMADERGGNSVQLIYFNTNQDFLFQEEFDSWQRQLPGLAIDYVVTKELGRKDREKLLKELLPDLQQQYYVSGPSGMVSNTIGILEKFGVVRKNIKVDDFGHY